MNPKVITLFLLILYNIKILFQFMAITLLNTMYFLLCDDLESRFDKHDVTKKTCFSNVANIWLTL